MELGNCNKKNIKSLTLTVENIVSLLDDDGYRLDLENGAVYYYNLMKIPANDVARDMQLKIIINTKIARVAYEVFGVQADYKDKLFDSKTLREYIEQRVDFINVQMEKIMPDSILKKKVLKYAEDAFKFIKDEDNLKIKEEAIGVYIPEHLNQTEKQLLKKLLLIKIGSYSVEAIDMGTGQQELADWAENHLYELAYKEKLSELFDLAQDEGLSDLLTLAIEAKQWQSYPSAGGLSIDYWNIDNIPSCNQGAKQINHLEFAQRLKSTSITTKITAIWNEGSGHKKGYIHNVLNYDGFNVAYINTFTYPNGKPLEAKLFDKEGPLWEIEHQGQKMIVVNDDNEEIPLYDLGDIITEFTDIEKFDLSVFNEDDTKLVAQVTFDVLKERNGSITHEDVEYAYITPAALKTEKGSNEEGYSFYQAEAISLSQLMTINELESTTNIDLTFNPHLSLNFNILKGHDPLDSDKLNACSWDNPSSFELVNDSELHQFLSQ